MMPIFADDAPLDAKREVAYQRLIGMCPEPMRLLMGPMIRAAMSRATIDEIDALLIDVAHLPELAANGDVSGITNLARRYGASDEMVDMYLPLFESAVNSGGLAAAKRADGDDERRS